MADWRDRPKYEGGRNLAARQRARVYARRDLVPPSKNDAFQEGTTSYSDKARYNGTNRVTNGLLCEWWFDEGSGNTIFDRTTLTKESPLEWIQNAGAGLLGEWSQDSSQNDRYYLNLSAGGAARNSGSTEFIAGPMAANEVTMEAWFKPSDQAGLATSGPGRIATLTPLNTTYTDQCVMLGHGTWTGNASNHNARAYAARVKLYDTVYSLWSADDTAVTDQLVHLVVTAKYNTELGRAEARFYVDGTLVDSKNIYDVNSQIFYDWDPTARIATGASRDGEKKAKGGYYLTAVYRRALTAAEVSQNFEEGVSPKSGGYKKGTRAVLNDGASTLDAGKADKFEVSLSGGVHLDKLTVTLTASSDNAGFTLGKDFTLTPTSVDLLKGTYTQSVSLSCAADTSADHTVHVSVNSISNNEGTTVVESPSNDAYDSFDVSVTSKVLKPELKISYDQNPTVIPTTSQPAIGVFTVSKTRDYDEQIEFTFEASADLTNVADYYFLSGGAPGVFSAPFRPEPGINCGYNNDYLINTLGYNGGSAPTLTAYTGSMNITADGTTIQDKIITGTLNINADNVTLKNCLITNSGSSPGSWPPYTLNAWGGANNLLIEDCTISKAQSSCVLLDNGQTMRRCHLEDTKGDLLKSKKNLNGIPDLPCLVESCHFTKMGYADYDGNAHADAWQLAGAGGHLICRWNYFNIPGFNATPPNRVHSASIIWLNKGKTSLGGGQYELEYGYDCGKFIIDSNWFYGGSNAICLGAIYGDVTDSYVINNKFYGTVDDYDIVTGTDVGMPWVQNLLAEGETDPYTNDTKCFNNRLYDGSLAYRSGQGPNNPSVSLIDNVTSAPSIPFYDSPTGNFVDLSTGITLSIAPDELSRVVTIYSQATDSQGVFVDGDIVRGFLQSGSVVTGDDAGTSLSVCSTLSTLDVEFNDSGLLRSGEGGSPTKSHTSIITELEDDRERSVVETFRVNTYSTAESLDDEDYNQRIELPPVGGETSSTTGPRVAVTDHPHHDICWFVDPGQSNAPYKIEVPAAGLVVSGYAFKEVRIKTSNTLKFIDCEFSGQTDCHNGVVQQYTVWDNNQGGEGINRKVDFEYCDFQGGGSVTLMMNFRKLHKCRFDNVLSDYIRFRSGSYRITNCWFGSYMKAPDSALNGNNGHYNENQGINPHADPMQNFLTNNPIICIYDCTFNQRPANWSDGSINPDHERGAYPDKIMQIGGTTANPTASVIGECRFWNCILNGGGNYMLAGPGPNKMVTPATFTFKDCKFGTSFRSGHFGSLNSHHSRVDLGGNVWLETGTPGIRLPQEALDAGTTTTLGRNNLPISYVIRGLDNVNFGSDGMNEGGKTSWGQRGIGWG